MIGPILRSRLINACGRTPFVGPILRASASHFDEGSVVSIRSGVAAGMKWRRYHRFVNAYWLGSYELTVQLALQRLLRPGDVFYDVGANAGFFTVLAGKLVGSRGKVFAFEPVPENVEAACEQVALNGLSWCEIVSNAVGSRRAPRTFSYAPGSPSMGRLGDKRTSSETEIAVETLSLDDFVSNRPFPALVKIDVEGAEVEVLEGARSIVGHGVCVVIELHGPNCAAEVSQALGREHYALESLEGAPLLRCAECTWLVARPSPS